MTRVQWETLARVAVELAQFYRIPVTPTTVLGHGEVEVNCGKPQKQKWDPMILPWNQGLSRTQVGTMFRAMVQNFIDGPESGEEFATVQVVLRGRDLGRIPVANSGAFARSSDVARLAGWTLERFDDDEAVFRVNGASRTFPGLISGGECYVDSAEIARALDLTTRWDETTDRLIIE